MEKDQKIKLIVGVVVLVLAGLLLAWQFGLFEGSSTPTRPAPNATPQPPPQPPAGSPSGPGGSGSQPPPVG